MNELNKLRKYSECTGRVKDVISESDMMELIKSAKVPHYVLINPFTNEHNYYFAPAELNKWFYDNYVHNVEQAEYKLTFISLVDAFSTKQVPKELAAIKKLYQIPPECYFGSSGIYFLCLDGKIVYIGQSVNIAGRIAQHVSVKEFDSVFYIIVPVDKLDEYETALIRYYNPPLNKGLAPLAKNKHVDIDAIINSI